MPHFALTYKLADDYLQRREPFTAPHMKHIADAVAGGGLVIVGVLGLPPSGAIYMFNREGAAEEFAGADTYVTSGFVTEWSVQSWIPVVGPGAG